jgi:hypothetical protein
MGPLKDYDPEPLIEAITALDWSTDHPDRTMKAIQDTVRKNFGDELSQPDAMKLLGNLVERRFIRTQVDPPPTAGTGWRGVALKAKYFRVPDNER